MPAHSQTATVVPFYVYLFRDPSTMAIRYIGKGTGSRAVAHIAGSHNAKLNAWLSKLERARLAPVIELLPCAGEAEAYQVEAALISALWDPAARFDGRLLNSVRGRHGRFGPLGLPDSLVERRFGERVSRADIAGYGGALVVYIGPRTFASETERRAGAMPRMVVKDSDIYERIVGWWQVGTLIQQWRQRPTSAPKLIVGVTGPPARRWVYGAIAVTASEWKAAREDRGLWRISPANVRVDARHLRGRLLEPGAVGPVIRNRSRGFGGITAHFFDHVPGRRTRRP